MSKDKDVRANEVSANAYLTRRESYLGTDEESRGESNVIAMNRQAKN